MKKLTKIAGVCFLALGLAACGGGSDGGSRIGNNGGSNGAGNGGSNGGTSVASRTGTAKYSGTFNAKATPQGSISSGGQTYKGGDFNGRVVAEADFNKDEIDVDLIGTPKANVMERYEAEFDDVAIKNGKFSGQGEEEFSANRGTLNVESRSEIDGSFNANGSKISGKTATQGGLVKIETDFSASEK